MWGGRSFWWDRSSGGNSNVSSENKVRDEIWNFFINKGFSTKQTAAICGNASQESSYNPKDVAIPKDPTSSMGLWQMNGKRRLALEKLCKENNWDCWSTRGQCEHLWKEYNYTKEESKAAGNENHGINLRNSKIWNDPNSTIEQLTKEFCKVYEGAGTPKMENRINGANDAYNAYCK